MAKANAGVMESFVSTVKSSVTEKLPAPDPIDDATLPPLALKKPELSKLHQHGVPPLQIAASGMKPLDHTRSTEISSEWHWQPTWLKDQSRRPTISSPTRYWAHRAFPAVTVVTTSFEAERNFFLLSIFIHNLCTWMRSAKVELMAHPTQPREQEHL